MADLPYLLRRRPTSDRPGEATIEAIPTTPGRVTVRISGRDVANAEAPDTVEGWARTVAALRECGWVS